MLWFEFIPVSLNGGDQDWSTGIIFELLAEREDVYIHRATIRTLVVAPHCPQEFRSRYRLAGPLHKIMQQAELLAREVHDLAIASYLLSRHVHTQRSVLMHSGSCL